MKKRTVNNFPKGLITDLNPLSTPPDVLVEAKNLDYITTEGDQIILQKRMGNDPEIWVGDGTIVKLTSGFKPVAVKELNNVAYIISYNETTGQGELGTFPSPTYEDFKYIEGASWPGVTIDITSEFDDGLGAVADFVVDPTLIKNTYVLQGELGTFTINIENKSTLPDFIFVEYDDTIFQISQNPIPVNGLGTNSVDFIYSTSDLNYIPAETLKFISMNDPAVQRDVEIVNITIYGDGLISEKTHQSVAIDSGNNTVDTGIYVEYVDEPIIIKLAFAFDNQTGNFDNNRIRFHGSVTEFSGSHIFDYTDVELVESDNPVNITNGIVTFTESTTAKFRLKGTENETGTSRTPNWVGLDCQIIDPVDATVETTDWEGDITYGLGTGEPPSLVVSSMQLAGDTSTKWAWGRIYP